MMKSISFFLLTLLLVFIQSASAQSEDLREDKAFFEQQKDLYQKWLDKSGLGEVLYTKDIEITEERVNLYLAFHYQKIDSIVFGWDKLVESYRIKGGLSIEQTLFYKWVNLIEIPQGAATVQIYDTYDLSKVPLYYHRFYFEENVVKDDSSGYRAPLKKITLRPPDQSQDKQSALLAFKKHMNKAALYDKIITYSEKRYETTSCENRHPNVVVLENEEVLRFEVLDLCKEVLIDETQPTLCGILKTFGRPCNWVKREMLIFTVSFEEMIDGVRLHIEIDGKYGSGFYDKVKRGGYISMEIDFDEYLERYADLFKEDLKRNLK